MSGNPYIGVGIYSIPEAARLIGVQPLRLRRWAFGYGYRLGKKQLASPPLGQRDFRRPGQLALLSFAELIEFKMIRMFRDQKIPMREIRQAAQRAERLFGAKHPFAVKQFQTDGRRIFADLASPQGEVCEELSREQWVFDEIARPFFRKIDYQAGYARQYWPLGKERGIVLDPARSFGEPIDHESGVPTAMLYELYTAGETVDAVADWYQVTPSAVHAAIEYEQALAA